MRQVVGFGIGPREGVLLGANLGRAIVTNGDFTAYVCDSAATQPSSQITLDTLVRFSTFDAWSVIYVQLCGVNACRAVASGRD